MIPGNDTKVEQNNWQTQLQTGFSNALELLTYLDLANEISRFAEIAQAAFPLRVPRFFADQMERGNINDPLLKQILPVHDELIEAPAFVEDPLQEHSNNPLPGLLHKYQSRILLTLSSVCAVNCRYCFRRHFPYKDNNPGKAGWHAVAKYIEEHPEINEVIFSGGDPLILNDNYFLEAATLFLSLPNIKRLRIHSRIPIVLPDRLTTSFIEQLGRLGTVILVTHANHPNEITPKLQAKMTDCKRAGIHLLNQSVLLKGINDDPDTLIALSERLFEAGILPYYLHQLDQVKNTSHFYVDDHSAKQLMQQISGRLPGFLVPKFSYEAPGTTSKQLIPY